MLMSSIVVACMPCSAAQTAARPTFEGARRLELEGKLKEAFGAYLAIPGAEHAAVRVGRRSPKESLAKLDTVLAGPASRVRPPYGLLVRGDLLLVAGDKEAALECYRRARRAFANRRERPSGRVHGHLDYYPVETSRPAHMALIGCQFAFGPGSHRDNWLIRRFIALQAWDDAAREFERVWDIHRHLASGAQFKGLGLRFAIDYTYFLKRRGHTQNALGVLLEPLSRLDLEEPESVFGRGLPGRTLYAVSAAGVSRKEFIRIAYGAFGAAGEADILIRALSDQIEAADNRARRVLARVRLHQGKIDEALALELAFIEAGGFDPLSAAYRRARVYERFQRLANAAAEYEKAFSLPYVPLNLPQQAASPSAHPRSPAAQAQFRSDLLTRLRGLYTQLDRKEELLDVAVRQFDVEPHLLGRFRVVEDVAQRFRTIRGERSFAEWARRSIAGATSPVAKANLYWFLRDYGPAINELLSLANNEEVKAHTFEEWKRCLYGIGKDRLMMFLRGIVAACPEDGRSRLELLAVEGRFVDEQTLPILQALVEGRASYSFGLRESVCCQARFRNHFDVGYRLMRLYERRGDIHRLRALGLHIASRKGPFRSLPERDPSKSQGEAEISLCQDANACLSLAIQHADEATLNALDKLSLPRPAKTQLARRRAGGWQSQEGRAFGWANLPKSVAASVCNENVLSLDDDDRYVYAGMPWGVAVYSHQGQPVVRIALAAAALDLLAHRGELWVATPIGLKRVTIDSWEVAVLPLDSDVPDRNHDARADDRCSQACVLAGDGRFIWIGTRRNIQRFDTHTETLRVFSEQELRVDRDVGAAHFIVDTGCVWADGGGTCGRYGKETGRWRHVVYRGKPVRLLVLANGLLWGNVCLNRKLRHRPCLIDRQTLEVTPILIEEDGGSRPPNCQTPFAYYGTWEGKPVFGTHGPSFYYDDDVGKLRRFSGSVKERVARIRPGLLPGLRSEHIWRKPNGTLICRNSQTHRHEPVPGLRIRTSHLLMAKLPEGAVVLGARRARCPSYECSRGDWPKDREREFSDEGGGLYFVFPDKTICRASSEVTRDSLPSDTVFDVILCQAANHWACTNRGVAALNEDAGVLAHFTRDDGLCANRVLTGVVRSGLVYLATSWGGRQGGLAVYDPRTSVFTSFRQADGLATDKVKSVEIQDGKLKLLYDLHIARVGYGASATRRYELHPPGVLDPQTGVVTAGGAPQVVSEVDVHKLLRSHGRDLRPAPLLGGAVLSERTHGGRRYLCGTRGLLIQRAASARPLPAETVLEPRLVLDPIVIQQEQARIMRMRVHAPSDLARYFEHENPFVRMRAVAGVHCRERFASFVPLIVEQCMRDPYVRKAALYGLTKAQNDQLVAPVLNRCLQDDSCRIRATAVVDLVRRGLVPEHKYLREVLSRANADGDSASALASAHRRALYGAIAPHLTPELLSVLMEYPAPTFDGHSDREILKAFGHRLRELPVLAKVLLRVRDRDAHRWRPWRQLPFPEQVFRHAGRAMLPVLHRALASRDRVVRSNAARACGAIGDPSSIPCLIEALDLESGLSRASIVWALGELKAREALPHLVRLYIDAKNDEQRRPGAGFRLAQSTAAIGAQYERLRDLEAIGAEWDELKAAATPGPVDPRRKEDLLDARHILDAAGKMGVAASRQFRRLAAGE